MNLTSFSNMPYPSLGLVVGVPDTGRDQKPVWGSREQLEQSTSAWDSQGLPFPAESLSGSFSKCHGLIG